VPITLFCPNFGVIGTCYPLLRARSKLLVNSSVDFVRVVTISRRNPIGAAA
jgi:hypothetical protein